MLKDKTKYKRMSKRDFPGSPVVKNPPSNAGVSIPGRGTKIPHAVGQLSLCATTTEHTGDNYRADALWSPCTTTGEKPARRSGGSLMPQLRPKAGDWFKMAE